MIDGIAQSIWNVVAAAAAATAVAATAVYYSKCIPNDLTEIYSIFNLNNPIDRSICEHWYTFKQSKNDFESRLARKRLLLILERKKRTARNAIYSMDLDCHVRSRAIRCVIGSHTEHNRNKVQFDKQFLWWNWSEKQMNAAFDSQRRGLFHCFVYIFAMNVRSVRFGIQPNSHC